MTLTRLSSTSVLLLALPSLSLGQEAGFPNEAWESWKRYQEHLSVLLAKQAGTTVIAEGGQKIETTVNNEFRRKHDSYVFITKKTTTGGKMAERQAIGYGKNARYAFKVEKPKKDWVITKLGGEISPFRTEPFLSFLPREVSPHFILFELPLWEQAKKPDFVVLKAEEISKPEPLRKFFFKQQAKAGKETVGAKGWVILFPKRWWCITELEMSIPQNQSHHLLRAKFQTRSGDDDFPILEKEWFKLEAVNEDKTPKLPAAFREGNYQWEVTQNPNISDEEFTLSAFGLREPAGFERKSLPWYLWLAISGLVCITGAVGVRWLKGRSGTKPVAVTDGTKL